MFIFGGTRLSFASTAIPARGPSRRRIVLSERKGVRNNPVRLGNGVKKPTVNILDGKYEAVPLAWTLFVLM